ncbi:hypothetical protein BLA29_009148 [Euroglyphus maynei]|uniref:Uncharacterized protein n=1 Tax=Euroglyphus maynei TaxID=6958 RepID=A0A1Y3BCQ0_EURMA|nr:hypothetical protein BLA29_009148 [Euroglyphus maynei]
MGQMMTKGLAILSEKTTIATNALKQPFKSSPFRRELREKFEEMTKKRQQTKIDGDGRIPSSSNFKSPPPPPPKTTVPPPKHKKE